MQSLAGGFEVLVELLKERREFESDLALGLLRVWLQPIAARVRPVTLAEGVVTLEAVNINWRREAEPLLESLLPRLNRRFGREVVREIAWVPLNRAARQDMLGGDSRSPVTAPDTAADSHDSGEIRTALREFDVPRTHEM